MDWNPPSAVAVFSELIAVRFIILFLGLLVIIDRSLRSETFYATL